jgi:hypothetical protein
MLSPSSPSSGNSWPIVLASASTCPEGCSRAPNEPDKDAGATVEALLHPSALELTSCLEVEVVAELSACPAHRTIDPLAHPPALWPLAAAVCGTGRASSAPETSNEELAAPAVPGDDEVTFSHRRGDLSPSPERTSHTTREGSTELNVILTGAPDSGTAQLDHSTGSPQSPPMSELRPGAGSPCCGDSSVVESAAPTMPAARVSAPGIRWA